MKGYKVGIWDFFFKKNAKGILLIKRKGAWETKPVNLRKIVKVVLRNTL